MADKGLSKLKIEKTEAVLRARRRRPAFYLAVIVLVAIITVPVYFFLLNPVVEVEVATVSLYYPSQALTLLNASGYVVAQRKAAVASKATARLEWIGVEEGSTVREGQVIARLESEDTAASTMRAEAALRQAAAALDEARTELELAFLNFERFRELFEQGIAPKSDYDAADARFKRARSAVNASEAAVNVAEAALTSARVEDEYRSIRAPFDAVVLTKDADVGDIVTPLGAAANAKAAVVTIADLSSLLVEADVSESNLSKVRVGQPCEIQLDAVPGERFKGEVHMIVPTADRSKASVMVKVKFLDGDGRILPEMSARVAFLERAVADEEMAPKTGIDRSAVVSRGGGDAVFLIRGDRVTMVAVQTRDSSGDIMEILDGARAGDRVVLRPPARLKDGSRIRVREL